LESDLAIPYSGVDTKEASNKDDNYHYADDVENVHCELRLRYGDFNMKARRLNRKRAGLTLSSVVQAVDLGDRRDIATRDVPLPQNPDGAGLA
jgi:hypothetical protein